MRDILKMMNDNVRESIIQKQAETIYHNTVAKCSRCGGQGYLPTPFLDEQSLSFCRFPCSCMRIFIHSYDFLLSGINPSALMGAMKRDIDDPKIKEIDIGEEEPTIHEGAPLRLYRDFIDAYISRHKTVIKNGYSFLFVGVNSTGKTFSAIRIVHNYLRRGYTAHYFLLSELMKAINKSITSNGRDRVFHEGFVNEVKGVDILVIDEVGKEKGNLSHVSGEVESILKERDMYSKPSILISNDNYKDIVSKYTSSSSDFSSAFTRSFKVLLFDSRNDFRRRYRKRWTI